MTGRVSDSVTRQRHLQRKLNCRGDRFATYQQVECTGRMNSPLQDCNYLGVISVVVSYSKDYQREAGILKIEFFSKKQNPSRRRYSRYEEAYLQSTKSQHYKLAAG